VTAALAAQAGIDPQRWRAAEQGFHPEPWQAVPQGVRRSSRGLPWRGLWVWQQAGPVEDLYLAPAGGHCIILRNGAPTQLLQRQGGETQARQWCAGEAVVVPAGTPTFWRSEQPRDNVHIDLLPQWLERANGDRGPVRLQGCFGAHDPLLAQLATTLLASLDNSSALHPAFGDAMAMALAVHLLEHHADTAASQERAWALSARQLRSVTEYVRANLRAPCDVARLAAEVGLSPAHFSRCFKATCGVTPHQFASRLKMEHARELLLTTGLPVADVAQATGFASRAHFAQVFRRHWGAPPAALRRQG
jgi:AraC family transcriptional regulator